MADRSIKVTLRADTGQFQAGMQQAGKAVDDLAQKAGGQGSGGVMQRMAQSARDQRAEWQQVGGAVAGVGAAWTAVNVAVAKTGIEYNTLQQTSRAALKSILGDAEAVNTQMDALDAFAKTSPFSKATFITAQQQMLAFGIESEKVIGYLSAINDATAAAGGNNQTLSELAFIMAQVGAAGKITAQDLMQFGQRGVNAAELIGSQMGKTGAQIREDISDGALDANVALDALAAGMSEKFAGASENVKETMGGALDRVSAAWRDLSASIMESAVSPDGGGWLVDLTNSVADFIRGIEALPQPVKEIGGIVSGVGGAATLAAGGFLLAAPRIVETRDALKTLGVLTPGVTGKLVALGKGAAIAAAGFLVIDTAVKAMVDEKRGIEEIAGAIDQLATSAGSMDDLNMALPEKYVLGVKTTGEELIDVYREIQYWQSGMLRDGIVNNTLQAVFDAVGWTTAETTAKNTFRAIDEALRSLDGEQAAEAFRQIAEGMEGVSDVELMQLFPEYAQEVRAQLQAMSDEMGPMIGSLSNVANVMRGDLPEGTVMTAEGLMTVAAAAEAGIDPITGLGIEMDEIKYKMVDFSGGFVELNEVFAGWIEMVGASSSSFVSLSGAYDSVIEKNREAAEAAAEATESSKDSWEDFYDGTTVAMADWIAALDEQVAAQQEWQSNMSALAGRVSSDMLDHLAELGPEGAAMVKDLANMTSAELAAMEERFRQSGRIAGNDWADQLAAQEAVFSAVGAKMGDEAMRGAQEKVRSGEATLAQIIDQFDLVAEIDADGGPALAEAERVARQIANMRAVLKVTTVVSGVPTVNSVRGGGYGIDSANGNIIDYYANGGLRENHFAQIAPAGAWRVWAEPETGGESYIPLAPHKRARSLDIWHETGRRLGVQGYADGGFYAPSFTPSGVGSSSTTYGAQTNTYHLSFPGMTEVADVIAVIKDAPRQARLNGGRR